MAKKSGDAVSALDANTQALQEQTAALKVRETRRFREGFAQVERRETRVRELAEGEAAPDGAEAVPHETPVHDWQREEAGK